MKERTQAEADIALHLYGQRMRAIWDQKQADFEKHFAAFKDAARDDVDRAPAVDAPKIEAPEISPPNASSLDDWMKDRTKGIEPPEIGPDKPKRDGPDLDR